MKKFWSGLLASLMILSLFAACGRGSANASGGTAPAAAGSAGNYPTAEAPVTFKMAYDPPPKEITDLSANEFKRIVEEKTGGAVKLELYPQNQLGSTKVMFDGLVGGTIDMVLSPWNMVTTAMPEFNAMNLPFNIDSQELYWKVVGTDEFKEKFNQVANKKGLIFLGVPNGVSRGLISKTPIHTPADMKGQKVRVMDGPIYTDMFGAWGAGTSVISFGECYTALQQGVIDVVDNDAGMGVLMKFFEVAKNYTPTGHIIHGCPMFINQASWDKLSPEQQQIMKDAAKEMEKFSQKTYDPIRESFTEQAIKDFGVTIYDLTDADRQQWVDAVKPVYAKYEKEIGEDFYKWFMAYVDSKR